LSQLLGKQLGQLFYIGFADVKKTASFYVAIEDGNRNLVSFAAFRLAITHATTGIDREAVGRPARFCFPLLMLRLPPATVLSPVQQQVWCAGVGRVSVSDRLISACRAGVQRLSVKFG